MVNLGEAYRKLIGKTNKISSPQSHTLLFGDFSQGEGV